MAYWRGAAEDEAMQDEHGFIWQALIDNVGHLAGLRVLDAGCNRGGFLRLLADQTAIAEGYGFDPASAAIDDARRLTGHRPLVFEVAGTVPSGWAGFDYAFSHEVLYLLHDLGAHAAAVFAALKPGGAYLATMGVHARSPLMSAWHAAHANELGFPRLYDLDEVAETFEVTGFQAEVGRLRLPFVPVAALRSGQDDGTNLMAWLDYYNHDKVLFRLTRPRA